LYVSVNRSINDSVGNESTAKVDILPSKTDEESQKDAKQCSVDMEIAESEEVTLVDCQGVRKQGL
jgi:hypothetical protein